MNTNTLKKQPNGMYVLYIGALLYRVMFVDRSYIEHTKEHFEKEHDNE